VQVKRGNACPKVACFTEQVLTVHLGEMEQANDVAIAGHQLKCNKDLKALQRLLTANTPEKDIEVNSALSLSLTLN
jgi:hypothetical protein